MGWYQDKIFPFLLNINMGKHEMEERRKLLSNSQGNVLEIGIGTGINLSLYPPHISELTAVDCYPGKLLQSRVKVKFYKCSADRMPFPDNTFDTVVSTFCLCSVKDFGATLQEVRRVLKPNGKFLLLEHGKATRKLWQRIQNLVIPYLIFLHVAAT
jgi:ubiquinone/menaquinone biosynthesis C-methylase UbiE